MIRLTFTVDNISTVSEIYDRIEIRRSSSTTEPTYNDPSWESIPYSDIIPDSSYYTTVDTDGNIILSPTRSVYVIIDRNGNAADWYSSRYFSTTTSGIESLWSDPVLGEEGDLYYNPLYPEENGGYGTSDKRIIDRIRMLIGDPVGLRREYGEEAYSSVHPDGRVYEMDEKGWPANIIMGGIPFNDGTNPYVNGYKYLLFTEDISKSVMVSGTLQTVDIWYYTFRHSDREIMEAYDNTPPPLGLTEVTATPEAYMLACAIDLIRSEFILDATEDGATITDEGSKYDPSPGLKARKDLLDDLKKKLDDLVKTLILSGIEGVLID